jgi:hypothetical protein
VIDRRPGGALLHPVALLSIALLIVNDHFLKPMYANWITGKLSDFAGLVFFPLLLVSAWELFRGRGPSRSTLNIACAATAVVFTLVKTTALGSLAFQWGLGLAQWPFRALAGVPLSPVAHVADPTDLVALPSVLVAWLVGRARVRPERSAPNGYVVPS